MEMTDAALYEASVQQVRDQMPQGWVLRTRLMPGGQMMMMERVIAAVG